MLSGKIECRIDFALIFWGGRASVAYGITDAWFAQADVYFADNIRIEPVDNWPLFGTRTTPIMPYGNCLEAPVWDTEKSRIMITTHRRLATMQRLFCKATMFDSTSKLD